MTPAELAERTVMRRLLQISPEITIKATVETVEGVREVGPGLERWDQHAAGAARHLEHRAAGVAGVVVMRVVGKDAPRLECMSRIEVKQVVAAAEQLLA